MLRNSKTIIGIAIQPTPGVFVQPVAADLIAIYNPANGRDPVTADDPSLNGTLDANPRILLGMNGTVGATVALRGHGLSVPPAANTFVLGKILQSAGFTELRLAAALSATVAAGGDTDTMILDAAASAVDDFYTGMVVQHAGLGTGLRGHSMVTRYTGATKAADIGETLGAAIVSGAYTFPPQLSYVLSGGGGPLLSISVWRDKLRYDYVNCVPTTLRINTPVASIGGATDLPSLEWAMQGDYVGKTAEDAPAISRSLLGTIPPFRGGKFAFAKKKIGHASATVDLSPTSGRAPNANYDLGAEAAELTGRARTVSLDLNELLPTELNVDAVVDAQTEIDMMEIWGLSAGNRFGLAIPQMLLNPLNPGTRDDLVNISGDAFPNGVNRSICLSIF